MANVSKFINASNKNLGNNVVFKQIAKSCTIIFVEGEDDIIFYKHFLCDLYNKQVPQFAKSSGKESVIDISIRNDNKQFLYIIDHDYDGLRKYSIIRDNVLLTTGYSMENFFFYEMNGNHQSNINYFFETFVDRYYRGMNPDLYCSELVKEFLKELNVYKQTTLPYYASRFTMALRGHNLCFYSSIKEIVREIDENIPNLLSLFDESFKKEFEERKKYIDGNGYLWLRGHDIFNLLTDFLNRKKSDFFLDEINKKMVLECACNLKIPQEFKDQFVN